ncbi:hypothetical protein ABFU18_12860 [Xanthomonas campestris pv. campestris]|uniref:hypothetical protein n=2 Tax=Xanthomonas TaxID=338 RepID=UPI0005315EA6|nr:MULTISPECIES: hypothetical protein [Xanthomonas]MEB1511076.1 hypothetical protein [Xanthomonas campestris pv. campestris]AZR35904.1 hypothetical protein NX08_017140 [Xanthomonas vasicola]KGR51708.1 hypothetical protein NX07_13185 [Xanthomonas vasicola]KGR53789.1 hypothetical protein NX09_14070 [Xanthomonas vasicola]KGT82136.1 hypothetical protein OC00_20875 [Xanthomonas vasicola]
MEITVTTARAAEILGIGYEGLRSYLKRGLLGSSGVMLPFVGRDAPAPDLSAVRATWKRFGFTDLCLMRLAKQLIGMGLTFEQANSLISREEMRRLFRKGAPAPDTMLVCWPPHFDFALLETKNSEISKGLQGVGDSAILIKLNAIADHVSQQLGTEAICRPTPVR